MSEQIGPHQHLFEVSGIPHARKSKTVSTKQIAQDGIEELVQRFNEQTGSHMTLEDASATSSSDDQASPTQASIETLEFEIPLHTDISGAWSSLEQTNFYIFSYAQNQTVRLTNDYEAIIDQDSPPNTFELIKATQKKNHPDNILLIPMNHDAETILAVPHPELQTADLYLFEMPDIISDSDASGGSHQPTTSLYFLQDKWTNKKFHVMLESQKFQELVSFLQTHEQVESAFKIEYTFDCTDLSASQISNVVMILLLSVSLVIAVLWRSYLNFNRRLQSRHYNSFTAQAALVLCALSCIYYMLSFVFGTMCPWPAETEEPSNLLNMSRGLIRTVLDAYIVFLTCALSYGFNIIRSDVNQFIFNVVFTLTASKFFLSQIETSLSQLTFLLPTLIVIDIFFNIMVTLVIVIQGLSNLGKLYALRSLMRERDILRGQDTRAQLVIEQARYRTNLLLACVITSTFYYFVDTYISFEQGYLLTTDLAKLKTSMAYLAIANNSNRCLLFCNLTLLLSNAYDYLLGCCSSHDRVFNAYFMDVVQAYEDSLQDGGEGGQLILNLANFSNVIELIELKQREPVDYQLDLAEAARMSEADFQSYLEPKSDKEAFDVWIENESGSFSDAGTDKEQLFYCVIGPDTSNLDCLSSLNINIMKVSVEKPNTVAASSTGELESAEQMDGAESVNETDLDQGDEDGQLMLND